MNLKSFETERLSLREWTLNDIDDLVEGLNNFEVAKNLTSPFPYTREHAKYFINKSLKNTKDKCEFAIVLKENNKVIGGTGIEFHQELDRYKGGIWLNQNYIGKGYGTEVWKARAKFAFEVLNQEELINGFYEFNNTSKHMQEKVGYKITGKKINYCPALQKEVVEIITKLTKEDFYNQLKKT